MLRKVMDVAWGGVDVGPESLGRIQNHLFMQALFIKYFAPACDHWLCADPPFPEDSQPWKMM